MPKAGQDKNCNAIDASALKAPHGCTTKYKVRVSGSNISKVVYQARRQEGEDGDRRSPFTYTLKTGNLSVGAHKLKSTSYFKSGKTKTQSATFQRCGRSAVNPKFTG